MSRSISLFVNVMLFFKCISPSISIVTSICSSINLEMPTDICSIFFCIFWFLEKFGIINGFMDWHWNQQAIFEAFSNQIFLFVVDVDVSSFYWVLMVYALFSKLYPYSIPIQDSTFDVFHNSKKILHTQENIFVFKTELNNSDFVVGEWWRSMWFANWLIKYSIWNDEPIILLFDKFEWGMNNIWSWWGFSLLFSSLRRTQNLQRKEKRRKKYWKKSHHKGVLSFFGKESTGKLKRKGKTKRKRKISKNLKEEWNKCQSLVMLRVEKEKN